MAHEVEREAGPDWPRHRLESWKEIAAYLGRDVRTAQRWERLGGLPVPSDALGRDEPAHR